MSLILKSRALTEFDVQQALNSARASLVDSTEGKNFGAWDEVLAFSLGVNRTGKSNLGSAD